MKFNFEKNIFNAKKDNKKDNNTPEKQEENLIDFFSESYKEEVLPIIEIIKPDDMPLEKYQEQVKEDLLETIKQNQLARKKIVSSPEEMTKEAKEALMSKLKAVLEDSRNYELKKKPDPELVKKAKIALLYEDDLSDFEKYFSNISNGKFIGIKKLKEYIVAYDDKYKFSESDIISLLKTKYAENLSSLQNDSMYYFGSYGSLDSLPEQLMISLIKAEEGVSNGNHFYSVFKSGLEIAKNKKYSNACLEQLLANGNVDLCLEFANKFEDGALDKILKSGLSHNSDPREYLKKLELSDDDFAKYLELAVKNSIGYKIRENFGKYYDKNGEVRSCYEDLIENKLCPVEIDSYNKNDLQNFSTIKEVVFDGYVGLALPTSNCREYVKKYAQEDYENFKKDIEKHDQEHLVFEYLKDEDKIKYAQKLISQGEEYKIIMLKKNFGKHSLGCDIFEKINEKDLVPTLRGELSIFKDLKEKDAFDFIDRGMIDIFINNIKSFNFSDEFLLDNRVQEAAFSEFKKTIISFQPNKARIVKETIPLPEDKIEEIILSAIDEKWLNNNSSVRAIISEFPEMKKYLEQPKYKDRVIDDLNLVLKHNWLEAVIDIMDTFPLDKEFINDEENQYKFLKVIKNNIPRDGDVHNFFNIIERFRKYVNLPEYFQKQKDKVEEIESSTDNNVKMLKDDIIKKIIHNNNPDESYNNILKLLKEAEKSQEVSERRTFLLKYINEFESNLENEKEIQEKKDNFFSVIDKAKKYNLSSALEDNWDNLYNKMINLSDEQLRLLSDSRVMLGTKKNFFDERDNLVNVFEILNHYNPEEQKEFKNSIGLSDGTNELCTGPFDEKNYGKAILSYLDCTEDLNLFWKDENSKKNVMTAFDGEYKNTALKMLSQDWKEFLNNKNNFLPPNLYLISKNINKAGGIGNLKHLEALGNLSYKISCLMDNPKTAEKTKEEIKNIFSQQEIKFDKEKVLQDNRSEFYNLSADIIEASPSLFTSFAPVLEAVPAKNLKQFIKDVFPFYQAQLVAIQDMQDDKFVYNPKDLVKFRQTIKDFVVKIENKEENVENLFVEEKNRLLEAIKSSFKDRFGLIKIPNEFNKDGFRSIQNCIRYIGNINERNEERETIISLFLGLELNNEWEKFRQGGGIKINEYFSEKKLKIIKPLLEKRKESFTHLSKVLEIPESQMPQFQKVLQEDVVSNMIGNIQTVDVKLENIRQNTLELTDPDVYENKTDKEIVDLLSKEGKSVGLVLSKIYGELSGKSVTFTENEKEIKEKMSSIFNVNNWEASDVKRIQDYIQPFSLISSMINKMGEEKVEENINDLKKRLKPNTKIIEIFNRLGEDFKQESGAVAFFNDVNYLESLIIKDSEKISPDEKEEVKKYLGSIKDKMGELEVILDKVKEYFGKIKKSSHLENNPLLLDRLGEIEKIIYSTDSNGMIISQVTKDLNLIIENMRQCLGCMRKEANNDTNLAFGDYNKFFIINQGEKNKGSISDEIVFLFPAQINGEKEEMTFVLDRVYGSKSSDILLSNIMAVYKKYLALKKVNPKANISVSVSNAAISSVGMDVNILEKKLHDMMDKEIKISKFEGTVNVPESSFSDNYIEFTSGSARQKGSLNFSGINIRK